MGKLNEILKKIADLKYKIKKENDKSLIIFYTNCIKENKKFYRSLHKQCNF